MKKILVAVAFGLSIAATSWVLLQPGLFRIHDYVHAARVAEMLRGLQSGHIPVRWSQNFGFGWGMPLFEFYAPLPYYVGAGIYWLSGNIVLTVKLLFLLCSIGTFAGMYGLGSRLLGRAGGVLAAVVFTLAPYRAVNLFVRGALSEAWGMMALPWVLLGIVQVIRQERRGWLTLVLGLVMLSLSHNLTTLLFVPVSVLFAGGYFLIEAGHRTIKQPRRVVAQLVGGYVLGFALTAFYLFPALLENDLTKVSGVFQGYFHYGNHFLYLRQFLKPYWGYGGSEPGPMDGISFFLGWGQWLGLVALGLSFLTWSFQMLWRKIASASARWRQFVTDRRLQLLVLNTLLLVLAIFMSLEKSRFIWDRVPFLLVVQFPWRWLSVVSVFEALLIGSVATFTPRKMIRSGAVVLISIVTVISTVNYFKPEGFLSDPDSLFYTDATRIRRDMSKTLNDYIPEQMKLDPISKELPPVYSVTVNELPPEQLKVLVDRVQEKLVQTNLPQPQLLQLGVADFPGWQLYIDGEAVTKQRAELGNIEVLVPAGEHLVGLQFTDTPVRQASDMASLFAGLVLVYLLLPVHTKLSKQKL